MPAWRVRSHRTRSGQVGFQRFWAAASVSMIGDELTLVALPLATYAETGSAVAVGVVAAAEPATALVLGLGAGALADRLPARRVLVRTDLVQAAVLMALVVVLVSPAPAFPALLVAAAALGTTRILHDAAAVAVTPRLVDGAGLLAANGRLQASASAATAGGPAAAGVLIRVGGAPLAFLLDAATFVWSALTLSRLRSLDRPLGEVEPVARTSLRQDVAFGIRALMDDRVLRRVLLLGVGLNVVSICLESQFIPFAAEELGVGALGVGAYFALGGAVAVATSVIVGRSTTARGDLLVASLTAYAAAVLLAGLAPSLATAALAYVAGGVGTAVFGVHLVGFRQRRFPLEMQGRVAMASRAIVLGPLPLALVGGGWIASRAGAPTLFVLAAGIGLTAAAWGWLTGIPALREG